MLACLPRRLHLPKYRLRSSIVQSQHCLTRKRRRITGIHPRSLHLWTLLCLNKTPVTACVELTSLVDSWTSPDVAGTGFDDAFRWRLASRPMVAGNEVTAIRCFGKSRYHEGTDLLGRILHDMSTFQSGATAAATSVMLHGPSRTDTCEWDVYTGR